MKLALHVCVDCWAEGGAFISDDGKPIVPDDFPDDYCPHAAVWPARVHSC